MLYHLHALNRAALGPATHLARAGARLFSTPESWLTRLPWAPHAAAGYELFDRVHRDYGKPAFGISAVQVRGTMVPVIERTELVEPFCRLQRFKRYSDRADVITTLKSQPTVLVVAPLSGHHATLLRDTVQALLADHKVYITDWLDAREVPVRRGGFTLADYVAYLRTFIRHIGTDRLHVIAVCQAAVPVLAAVAQMAAGEDAVPRSLTLMGGPIDTRHNPTRVNELARTRSLDWFRRHLVHQVPPPYAGQGRLVYPGFLQHASFMALNPARHMRSHWDFYQDLVRGDGEDAEAHRRFYDEYNAVLDMPAEYYLDCIRIVFQEHLLPRGQWDIDGERVTPGAITGTALLTIEGEQDDISGLGQTRAAHDLCSGIPADRKRHLVVPDAGHYGIFSGRRWRTTVYPQVRDFIAAAGASPSGS